MTVTEGTNFLVGTDEERIREGVARATSGRRNGGVPRYWDGQAAGRIAEVLSSVFVIPAGSGRATDSAKP